MIVFSFDDDRKFPLVSSLTTIGRAVRLDIVTNATERSLRVFKAGEDTVDNQRDIVLALPLYAVDGAPAEIELEVTGDTRPLQVYIEGSDGAGAGLVWELSGLERADRHVLSAPATEPHDRWDRGDDIDTPVTPPLTFQRLRLTVSDAHTVDIVLHELRLTGNVRLVRSGLADM